MTYKKKPFIYGCSSDRLKAIAIMEFIAEYLGTPRIFDCRKGNERWYEVEDEIVRIIGET